MQRNHAITPGIILQATGQHWLYRHIDAKGGGVLIELMKVMHSFCKIYLSIYTVEWNKGIQFVLWIQSTWKIKVQF